MFEIVKFKEEHIAQMVDIEKKCFKTPWTLGMFHFELTNAMAHYFIMEKQGEVVAYCGIYRILDEGHINNVAVKPEYQGQGLGRKLISDVLEKAKSSGIVKVTLEVNEHNERAIKLYEDFGFKFCTRRPKYYEGVDDALIYWLILTE